MNQSSLRSVWLFAAGCALVFLAAHLPFLASTLEDIDSVNFALALRDFDVAKHRPHPPGYPVFVAAGKVVKAALALVMPAATPADTLDARVLALLGVTFGALLAFPLLQVYRMLGQHEGRARAALVVALTTPLLWFTAARPLSDVTGLFATTTVQALLLTAWRRQRSQARARATGQAPGLDREGLVASGRLIVLGALAAGVAAGVRSQTVWLTLPVLLAVIVDRAGRGAAGAILGSSITLAIGAFAWLVPLVVETGGPAAYLVALSSQAGEDLAGVDMLATNPTPRRLLAALGHTLLDPWQSWWLAGLVVALSACGLLAMLRRERPATALILAMTVPYAVFHLLFHETFTTRYALPLMPALAFLAVRGMAVVSERAVAGAAVAVAAASLAITIGPQVAYARAGSPLSRAVTAITTLPGHADPVVAMHYAFVLALRDEPLVRSALPSTPRREWEAIARYWRQGGTAPVRFLADPKRKDLAAFDPATRHVRARYRWPFDPTRLLGGVRPGDVDVLELSFPGWFAERGSALTPELAGMSHLDKAGPADGGLTFRVRRRPEPVVVLVGGRNLGKADAPDARFEATLDGRPLRTWRVAPRPGFFLEMWTLEAGALVGAGPFAALTVTASAADGSGRAVDASVEQFDLQPEASVVYGFDRGWHEAEQNSATGRLWRWTSEASAVRVHHAGQAVRVRVVGESPLRYFEEPPTVTLRAGTQVLGTFRPDADFAWEVPVPAEVLATTETLTLATDKTFVPDERSGNGDRRRLGLRVYELNIEPFDENPR